MREGREPHDQASIQLAASSLRDPARRGAHTIELVIVDFLQLLTPPGRSGENRQYEVANFSRAVFLETPGSDCARTVIWPYFHSPGLAAQFTSTRTYRAPSLVVRRSR